MKKETRTWMLYYMVIVHIFAVLGTTGYVIMYLPACYPCLWSWLMLVVLAFVNYFIFDCMFAYIKRIRRRRRYRKL